jgi:hypothetical protein
LPVHPIAGKCKHCKADLAALRAPTPVAKSTLPSLQRSEPAPTPVATVSPWAPPGTAPPPAPAYDVPTLPAAPAPAARYQPTAAPYQTASRDAFSAPPLQVTREPIAEHDLPRGSRISWPVVVILIAGATIAAAVAIMLWPDHKKAPPKVDLLPPPAPERMNTDPLPERNTAPPQVVKPDIDPPPPRQDPDDSTDDDDTTGTQGSAGAGGLKGPLGGNGLGLTSNGTFALEVFKHACDRLATCTNADPAIGEACQQLRQMSGVLPPTGPLCAAAQRCLATIDKLDCNTQVDAQQLFGLLQKFDDCTEAMKGC